MRSFTWGFCLLLLVVTLSHIQQARAQCLPTWVYGSDASRLELGASTLGGLRWDPDGSGPEPEVMVLYGDMVVNLGLDNIRRVVTWDGKNFRRLGANFDAAVNSMAVINGELYAAGAFGNNGTTVTRRVARWNGSSWIAVGSNLGGVANAIAEYNGSIYVGGTSSLLSGNALARFNGTTWVTTGAAFGSSVSTLRTFSNRLIAGGSFTTIGSTAFNRIAQFDGTAWSALGSGMNGEVRTLAEFNGSLVAGGNFTQSGTSTRNYVARWTGSTWTFLGTGMNNIVNTLVVDGANLLAGGTFTTADGLDIRNLASWNGTEWSSISPAINGGINAIIRYQDKLHLFGQFNNFRGTVNSATLDGGRLFAFGGGFAINGETNGNLGKMIEFEGDLVMTGAFNEAAGQATSFIARRTGTGPWRPFSTTSLPPYFGGTPVEAMVIWNNQLVVGGDVGLPGETVDNRKGIIRWTGSAWESFGNGLDGRADALAVFRNELYAAGFVRAAGQTDIRMQVVRWTGTQWQSVGTLVGNSWNASINALTVYNDRLIALGNFTVAGSNIAARGTASWDGTNWSAMGNGPTTTTGQTPTVFAGTVFNNELVVGEFWSNTLQRWNGTAWSSFAATAPSNISALVVYANRVHAIGAFSNGAGVTGANGVARWTGSAWQSLNPSGINNDFFSTAASDGLVYRNELLVSGNFSTTGGLVSVDLGRYSNGGEIWIDEQPAAITPLSAATVVVRATPATGFPGATVQWQRESPANSGVYVNIVNGPGGASTGGGTVAFAQGPGAAGLANGQSAYLAISPLRTSDAGRYRVVLTTECNTVESQPVLLQLACGPADVGSQGGTAAPDNQLNNNDFAVFVTLFFATDARADVGRQGGLNGADGQWNNNDFAAFVNLFFAGCP